MATIPRKSRNRCKLNAGKCVLFISMILFCFINLNITIASPFRRLISNMYFDAEGINNFCGTNDINLYALGTDNIIFKHTYSFQWEYYEPKLFPLWWDYPEGTSKQLTIKVASVPYYLRVRCHVIEYVSGVYFTEWTTGEALLYVASDIPSTNTNPSDVTICEGSPASFSSTASGQGGSLTYQWYEVTPDNTASRITGATSSTYSLSPNPTLLKNGYKYKCRAVNGCGYKDSDDAVLNVNPIPLVELGSERKICEGSSTVLSPGGGYKSYLWNTAQTTQSITVSNQGSYNVTVVDNNNCSASDNVSVIVDPPLPAISLGKDKTLCKGELLIINAAGGYDSYLWNTGSSLQTLNVTESGKYSVIAGLNSSTCKTSDEINVTFAESFKDEKICMVMVDPETEKNMIIWEKTPNVGTEKYQVLKKNGTEYALVKETMVADTSYVIDWNSKPSTKNDAYVLVSIDTCGNISQKSPWHKPFFLQTNIGKNEVINLDWEPYLVDGVEYIFKSIIIYRGTEDSTKLAPIDTIPSGIATVHYTDENPPLNVKIYYRIGGEKEKPCDPNHILGKKASGGPYLHSLSNLEDNRLSSNGIINFNVSNFLRIFPNPMKTESRIRWENPDGENFDLLIFDLKGTIVRTETGLNAEEYILKRESLSPGCYIVELRGSKTIHGRLLVD